VRVSATQVGIELSPDACRIVEIESPPVWKRRRWSVPSRVRSFAVFPPSGAETEAKLASLKNQRAAVVVWNAASDHRQVMVDAGSYESMRAEAIRALDAVGVETRGAWIDIAPVSRASERKPRRPVIAVVAAAAELTAAVQPLYNAGIRVQTIVTPAVALGSLARLRRNISTPDALELYVALEERATCIALTRGRALMASQTRDRGFINEFSANLQPRGRDEIADWLTQAIRDFLDAIGAAPTDVTQVCLSGGLPEMRSMTALLMERLDVEVEPLDSLFRIDAQQLPEPADEFRERGAELRLAWAAAADCPPSLNLLRARPRQVSKTWLARGAVAAGAVAGLLVGWRVQQGAWWRTTAPRPAATIVPAASTAPASNNSSPSPSPRPSTTHPRAPATAPSAPATHGRAPASSPAVSAAPVPGRGSQAPAQPPARNAAPSVGQPTARPTSRAAVPLKNGFGPDAVQGTILYSPDRKLAIIDGRIVAPGDEIRGARIVDITATSVLVRDGEGRMRRLTLAYGER
jgi:hypothetical protein